MRAAEGPDRDPAAPHFLIIGACKSGTTTLYDDLATHPGVCLPAVKEPDVLNRAGDAREAAALYARHFAGCAPGRLRGEGSTHYTMRPAFADVAPLARAVCGPDLKLIYVVRDPVDRIESHIAHDRGAGRVPADRPPDALAEEADRYVAPSDYAMQLRGWIDVFGPEAVLLLRFDDLRTARRATVARAARFLGLDPAGLVPRDAVSNPRGSQRAFRSPLAERLCASDLYVFTIRRMLPAPLRGALKAALTRRRDPAPARAALSPEARARLARRFEGQDAALGALVAAARARRGGGDAR